MYFMVSIRRSISGRVDMYAEELSVRRVTFVSKCLPGIFRKTFGGSEESGWSAVGVIFLFLIRFSSGI